MAGCLIWECYPDGANAAGDPGCVKTFLSMISL